MSCLCMIALAISHHDIIWNTQLSAKSVHNLLKLLFAFVRFLSFIVERKCTLQY